MRKFLFIALFVVLQIGCKSKGLNTDVHYLYRGGDTLNLPEYGKEFYILEILKDSQNFITLNKNRYSPSKDAYGFIGFYEHSDSLVKFYGIDTIKPNSPINVALYYFRKFYTLSPSLFALIKNINSPTATYMLLYSDSISPKNLIEKAMSYYNNIDSLNEMETYYLIKTLYEIQKGTNKEVPLLDSTINFYLKKWPYGSNSARIYYYLFSTDKIKKDTMLNVLKKVIIHNLNDPYALQFIAFFADTTIKGNKNKKYLKDLLRSIKKIPVNSTTLQLSFYIPEIFKYIDEKDTLNLLKRTFINEFGSEPSLIKLWAKSTLIEYHFAKGYYLKHEKKYDMAIDEFKNCRNYNLPNYYIEEADRQIIDIYKDMGKYRGKECKKVALHLLSKNPVDSLGMDVLGNPSSDSLFAILKPILQKNREVLKPEIKFSLLKGGTLHANELNGKAWVIKFWSVYCPHCRKEIPYENELYLELRDKKDFGFLACSINSKDEIKKFLDKNAFYFTQSYGCNRLRKYFKISGVPAYFILDKNGHIVFSHIGEDKDIKKRLKLELLFASKL